jgi:hypothetical protein
LLMFAWTILCNQNSKLCVFFFGWTILGRKGFFFFFCMDRVDACAT